MRSTTEHTPVNSGTGWYIYRVTIDIDTMFDTANENFLRKKIFERIVKKKKKKKKESGCQKISSKGPLSMANLDYNLHNNVH